MKKEENESADAARAAEARYRGLFDYIDSGVAVYTAVDDGADFVFADFNDAACRIDSVRRDDVIGRRVTEVFPGVREFGLLDVFRRVWRTGAPERFPEKQYRDDRIVGWRENYVYRLQSGEVIAIYRDLTAEKRAEEEITNLAKFPSENPNPILRVARNGTLLFANDAAVCQLPDWCLCVGKVAPPLLRDALVGAVQKESTQMVEFAHGDRTFSFGVTPIADTDYVNLYGRDVTDHKRADETLRENEARYRNLFERAPFGIGIATFDGKILTTNRKMELITGFSEEEFKTINLADTYVNSDDREKLLAALETSGTVADFPAMLKRKDGTVYNASLTIGVVNVAGRRVLQTLVQDITERKRAEQERESLQACLAQADRMASMGMLAAGVTHEIVNPLSYVLYNIESLVEDLPKLADGARDPAAFEDAVSRLREALEGAQRIKQITRSLSTFSRVDRAEVTPVDVQASIEHALTMAFNEIKYRARVVRKFATVPAVLASEGKLAQVFLNLFINAAHAIDEGHVEDNEIRVRTFAEGETVCIEVRDTGKGIAPEHQPRIFEPFFTTKGVGAGSGLGLSICKSIVESFGGEISFQSELDMGTRFRIRLPCAPSDWGKTQVAPEARSSEAPSVRGRILVVDDEAGIRATLARILGADHEVITVASGQEAMELLKADRDFDLVFCDLMMPKMTGMELHKWLAERDPALSEQVVFISGGAFTPGASKYLAEVKNLRLEKPFDTAHIRRLAAELVLAARSKRKG